MHGVWVRQHLRRRGIGSMRHLRRWLFHERWDVNFTPVLPPVPVWLLLRRVQCGDDVRRGDVRGEWECLVFGVRQECKRGRCHVFNRRRHQLWHMWYWVLHLGRCGWLAHRVLPLCFRVRLRRLEYLGAMRRG